MTKPNPSNYGSFANTGLVDIQAPMKETHRLQINLTKEWRRHNLKLLKMMVKNHRKEWTDALATDLGKDACESLCTEVLVSEKDIEHTLKHLKIWMKPQKVSGPGFSAVAFAEIERRPLRSPGVLVIGPSNYPLQLVMLPVAGSLAGGNPTVIKPSELCPATSQLMADLVKKYFDPGTLQVIQGGTEETTALLEKEWGLVFFTGSERVGRLVAAKTARTLTPTVLELGGKSPTYVDELAPSLPEVANRIIWSKTLNTGQTCVAPDYLLVHEKHAEKLCIELVKTLKKQFSSDPRNSGIGRIVQVAHAQRLVDLLKEVEKSATAKILFGGSSQCDPDSKYVCPTIVLNPPRESRMLTEEIFGPILPVIVVKSREEAIEFINSMPGTPLAMYVYTSSAAVYRQMKDSCPSASAMRNDGILHFANNRLPVGGLGSSGYGNYHGKFSFETFTHAFSSVYRPCFPGCDFGMIRYHPFGKTKAFLLSEYLMNLPELPVLPWRPAFGVVAVMLFLKFVPAVQPLTTFLKMSFANILEAAVLWLRSDDN
jgi:acyl-CoA reductase-like NAD-dependent aldehyde dehydrogenase